MGGQRSREVWGLAQSHAVRFLGDVSTGAPRTSTAPGWARPLHALTLHPQAQLCKKQVPRFSYVEKKCREVSFRLDLKNCSLNLGKIDRSQLPKALREGVCLLGNRQWAGVAGPAGAPSRKGCGSFTDGIG